ncbi:MAG TPA: hypothetical protein VG077_08780 [Verrucomicrobiae bacterium]|nr:hypothetical protein [Verrucomicrobiae bacterium]
MTHPTGFSFDPKTNWECPPDRRSGFRQKAALFNFLKFAALYRGAATLNWSRPVVFAISLLAGSALADTNLTWKADVTLKEGYDNNVYIQDIAPLPANVTAAAGAGLHAVSPLKSSLVTTILPRLGLNYQPGAAFNVTAFYAPEIALYTSAEDEDYAAHRVTLNFTGKIKEATWELLNSPTFIEGSAVGPTFARPDDCPAIGGIPLRDRREQFVFRNSFRVTLPFGKWFVRPVASSYYHDFLTDQRPEPANNSYLYENYVDRQDVNGGLDVGYDIGKKTFLVLGYRYGRQDQYKLLGVDSPYDSSYHRILVGVEGSPMPWLKLAALGGPEIRDWADGTPAGFDRNRQLYWVDASATLTPDKSDAVTLLFRRYEQPAFSSQSVYEDITYGATWKHKFNDHWAAGAGFQLYLGDWQAPVNRNDWIYTPSAGVTYTYNQHLNAELSWSYDLVDNKTAVVTGTPTAYADGREFSRDLVSLAVKYTF